MPKIKKIIIFLTILLMIVITILVVILVNRNANELNDFEEQNIIIPESENTLQVVDNKMDYYIIKDIVDQYYIRYATIFNERKQYDEAIEKYNLGILYNMLDEEYIKEKQVTEDNLKSKLSELKNLDVHISDIYVSEPTDNIDIYLVKGKLREKTTQEIRDFKIIVKLDRWKTTFCIMPQEYVEEKYNNLEIGKSVEMNIQERIEENSKNKYKYKSINDETYVNDLFTKFKKEINYYPELVYEKLDEEYRNKKFGTFEEFKKYINNNKEKYSGLLLEKYQKTITDDYKQYVCIDPNGNYYIFRENYIMNCSLILDTYTIILPEFIEKYNQAEENQKMILNIQKLIDATKEKDYKYVYSKINETFKSTNFKTQEDFEKYINQVFDVENDVITYKEYEEVAGVSIYHVEVIKKNKKISAQVVMELKDDRDFEISFSVEE